jgi:hypothetical protein
MRDSVILDEQKRNINDGIIIANAFNIDIHKGQVLFQK